VQARIRGMKHRSSEADDASEAYAQEVNVCRVLALETTLRSMQLVLIACCARRATYAVIITKVVPPPTLGLIDVCPIVHNHSDLRPAALALSRPYKTVLLSVVAHAAATRSASAAAHQQSLVIIDKACIVLCPLVVVVLAPLLLLPVVRKSRGLPQLAVALQLLHVL